MILSDILSLARLYVPEVDSTVISDVNVTIILNQAAQKFVYLSEALPSSTLFNAVASQQGYNLSTYVTTYAKPRPEGLWWYDSANSTWTQLKARTIKWLDENFPKWRDQAAGNPQYYSIDGDEITVHPKPNTSYTNGFKLYHFKVSVDMIAGYYPFSGSNSVRYPFLNNYEEDLIDYYKYRAKQIMGYGDQAQEALDMFTNKALKAKSELLARPDLTDARVKPQTRYGSNGGMFRG